MVFGFGGPLTDAIQKAAAAPKEYQSSKQYQALNNAQKAIVDAAPTLREAWEKIRKFQPAAGQPQK